MAKLPCPPELWGEFSTLLDQVLELPEENQLAWVDALGEDHAAVRPWLRRVIIADSNPTTKDFLSGPIINETIPHEFDVGQKLDHFTLIEPIGRGGMGEVWKAHRTDISNRQIALKLPHAHLLTGVLRRRFERERDILSKLSHAHIARLYSAGIAQGHPYLEMELVDGIPISRYCREHSLSIEQRLKLFLQVLEAVGYAHGQLVAHRDLKPSNILVSTEGQVKLLDFGIASMLGAPSSSDLTMLSGAPITPEYAAPEQLAKKPATVAVDIFALGIVLCELLTGRRPFDQANVRLDEAPPLASDKVDTAYAATIDHLSGRQLRRALNGDLDAIIAKALEHKPENRYRTAEAFAEDIRAHLDLRPISARHISSFSRAYKFIRRHRVAVSMASVLILTIIGSAAGVAWEAQQARDAAKRANATKDFLISVFRASDPRVAQEKPRGTITARELLELSVNRIEKEFASEPEIEIDLLNTISYIFYNFDDIPRAYSIAEKECNVALQSLPPYSARLIEACRPQLEFAIIQSDSDTTQRLLNDLDQRLIKGGLNDSAARGEWISAKLRAAIANGTFDSKFNDIRNQGIQLLSKHSPSSRNLTWLLTERIQYAISTQNLKDPEIVSGIRNDFIAAERVLSLCTDPVEDYRSLIYLLHALLNEKLGDAAGARDYFERAKHAAPKSTGNNSPDTFRHASVWSRALNDAGERDASLAVLDEVAEYAMPIEQLATTQTQAAIDSVNYYYLRLRTLSRQGKLKEAIIGFKALIEALRQRPATPENVTVLGRSLVLLGDALARQGDLKNARTAIYESYTLSLTSNPTGAAFTNWDRIFIAERLGQLIREEGNLAEAQRLLENTAQQTPNEISYLRAQAHAELALIALEEGHTETALQTADLARQEIESAAKIYDIRIKVSILGIYAQVLAASGDTTAAAQLTNSLLHQLEQYDLPESPELKHLQQQMNTLNTANKISLNAAP